MGRGRTALGRMGRGRTALGPGARPYGARPYGARPYEGGPAGQLNPAEWSEEVCELVLARSAVVRLGATVVSSDADLSIPAATPAVDFRGPGVEPAAPPGAAAVEQLSPREWRLEAWISIPNRVVRSLEANPELAQTLKADLAEALARRADKAFLTGLPPRDVDARDVDARDVAARAAPVETAGSLLETARDVVSKVRAAETEFHSPGWILHPSTLDALTSSTTTNGLVPEGAQPARSTRSVSSRSTASTGARCSATRSRRRLRPESGSSSPPTGGRRTSASRRRL